MIARKRVPEVSAPQAEGRTVEVLSEDDVGRSALFQPIQSQEEIFEEEEFKRISSRPRVISRLFVEEERLRAVRSRQ